MDSPQWMNTVARPCLHTARVVSLKCPEDAAVYFVSKQRRLQYVFSQNINCTLQARNAQHNTAAYVYMPLEVVVYRRPQRELLV